MAGFTTDEVYEILSQSLYEFPDSASDDILDFIMPISVLSENQGSTLSNDRDQYQDQFFDLGTSSGSNSYENIISWSTDAENGLCSLPVYNPTTHLETGTSSVGIDEFNQSYNSGQYISESSESSPINYTNMMEQGPSSFDQFLEGTPEPPYFPVMDSFGAFDENTLHIPRDEDIIVSDYLINEYPDSTTVDSHNVCQSELQVGNGNERRSQALWPSNEHSIFSMLPSQSELQMSYDVRIPFGEPQNSYNFYHSQNPVFSRLWLPFSSNDDARANQAPAVMTSINDISSRFNRLNWPEYKPSRTTTSYDYPHTLYQGPFRMPNLIQMLEPVTLAPKDYVITDSPPRSPPSSSSSVLRNRGNLSSSNSFTSLYQNSRQPDPRFDVDRHQNSLLHEGQSRFTTPAPATQMYANQMLQNSLLSRRQDSFYTNSRANVAINHGTELHSQTDKRKGKEKAVDYSSSRFAVGESWCPSTSYKGKYLSTVSGHRSTNGLVRNGAYDFAYEARDGSNKRMRFNKY